VRRDESNTSANRSGLAERVDRAKRGDGRYVRTVINCVLPVPRKPVIIDKRAAGAVGKRAALRAARLRSAIVSEPVDELIERVGTGAIQAGVRGIHRIGKWLKDSLVTVTTGPSVELPNLRQGLFEDGPPFG
jgi:hypothetical protein